MKLIKYGSVIGLAGFMIKSSYNGLIKDNYVFDIGLYYKDQFCQEGEVYSPNCEHLIPKIDTKGVTNL